MRRMSLPVDHRRITVLFVAAFLLLAAAVQSCPPVAAAAPMPMTDHSSGCVPIDDDSTGCSLQDQMEPSAVLEQPDEDSDPATCVQYVAVSSAGSTTIRDLDHPVAHPPPPEILVPLRL